MQDGRIDCGWMSVVWWCSRCQLLFLGFKSSFSCFLVVFLCLRTSLLKTDIESQGGIPSKSAGSSHLVRSAFGRLSVCLFVCLTHPLFLSQNRLAYVCASLSATLLICILGLSVSQSANKTYEFMQIYIQIYIYMFNYPEVIYQVYNIYIYILQTTIRIFIFILDMFYGTCAAFSVVSCCNATEIYIVFTVICYIYWEQLANYQGHIYICMYKYIYIYMRVCVYIEPCVVQRFM